MRGSPTILTPRKSGVVKKATKRKKTRAAVLGNGHHGRVKTGSILYDGNDRFVVSIGPVMRGDGYMWVKLYNQDLPEGAHSWFRLEDCNELAVILDEFEPSPVVL